MLYVIWVVLSAAVTVVGLKFSNLLSFLLKIRTGAVPEVNTKLFPCSIALLTDTFPILNEWISQWYVNSLPSLGTNVYWKNEVYGFIPELKRDPVGSIVTVCGWP